MVITMLKILFKTAAKTIHQLILNIGDNSYEDYIDVCKKIEESIIPANSYLPGYKDIAFDFQRYNISLCFRNDLLGEIETQIYNLNYINSLKDIKKRHRLVDDKNFTIYDADSLPPDKMNLLFNFGRAIDDKEFEKRLLIVKNFIPNFNFCTQRNLDPDDILTQRAVYRVLFKDKPHKFNKSLKANSRKDFVTLLNDFIQNNIPIDTDIYFDYSNAISGALAFEYIGTKENMKIKTDLLISLSKVFNSLYINLIPAVGSTLDTTKAKNIILNSYNKIYSILISELKRVSK